MPPPKIIEALDAIEHVDFRLVSCSVRGALGLQRGEEAFQRRVGPAACGCLEQAIAVAACISPCVFLAWAIPWLRTV